MDHFYTPPHNISSGILIIDGDEFAHLTHVMRKRVGDLITVVDGVGSVYNACIEEIAQRTARCTIRQHDLRPNEPDIDVSLAAAVLKNSAKFDFLIEKCTELGVNSFFPLFTERTISDHARVDRWRKLALAAMKQSARCVLPKVHDAMPLHQFLHSAPHTSLKILPHEKANSPTIRELLNSSKNTSVILGIGPEGGFSDEEVALAQSAGFTPVTLGPRRLRSETAAIVAAACCLS